MVFVLDRYLRWHTLRVFFEDHTAWTALCKAMHLPALVSLAEYESFLYGTDASVFIPLWASACKQEGAALLDATTRDVIASYKRQGYTHVDMQDNPPDYIGQQCRFLEYLSVIQLKDGAQADIEAAYTSFLQTYLVDTAYSMQRAADALEMSTSIRWVLQELGNGAMDAPWMYTTGEYEDFDSYTWHRMPEIPLSPAYTTTHASFGDCGGKCKMIATIQEGCVLSIEADTSYPDKRFIGCSRGTQYRQTYLSPRRLRYPMLRVGNRGEGKFRRISWNEAVAFIADAIQKTQSENWPESRYIMPGSGICAVMRGDKFLRDVLSQTGGYLDFYNYYSCACAETVLPYVYGTDVCGSSEEEMWKTQLLILWGHNPANTIWGDAFLPNLAKAKRAGVRIIVIDPRESETALSFADQWIGILPSTDGALADALAYEIWSRNLQDQDFMDRYCIGFDEAHMPEGIPASACYRAYLFGETDHIVKNAQWAEKITGIPADVICKLAIEYATTKPAILMPGLGPQRTLNGEQNCRSFTMLACLTGNVGKPGGGSGGYPNKHGHSTPSYKPSLNPFPGKIPSFLWPKVVTNWQGMTVEDGLEGVDGLRSGIKLMFSIASGMLMNQHSNINETKQILSNMNWVETLVVSELFMTPGARFADLLLPGVSFFETENLVPPWNASNYLLFNMQAILPVFSGRFEYDWVCDVARHLGCEEEITHGRDTKAWLEYLYEQHRIIEPELPSYVDFQRMGCYVYKTNRYEIAFYDQIHNGKPFNTPSGKIEIFSKRLYERKQNELPGIPRFVPCEEGALDPLRKKYPLLLIGYHTKRRCHTIHDNNPLLDRLEKPALWVHPMDASVRGIQDGDTIEVFNDRGCVRIPVKITKRIIPGAVALSEGGWYTPNRDGIDLRGSINVLTMSHRMTPLANANPQHTNLVDVRLFSK